MLGLLIGGAVTALIIYFVYRAFSGGDDEVYELEPAVVDTPTAGYLTDREHQAFMEVFHEVMDLTNGLLEGYEDMAELLDDDDSVEAAERFAELEEDLGALPEVAGQGAEFDGAKEAKWWAEHVQDLGERLVEAEGGKLASAAGGAPARGVVTASQRLLNEIVLACDDFGRRALGVDLISYVGEAADKKSKKRIQAALREAQQRLG